MSGGHFDYKYFHFDSFADELENDLAKNDVSDEYGYSRNYSKEVIDVLTKLVDDCRKAGRLAKEAEWLYSGDTSEKTFLERVKKIEEQ